MVRKMALGHIPWMLLVVAASAMGQDSQQGVHIFRTPPIAGYIDPSGNLLEPQIVDCLHLCRFRDGLAAVQTKDGESEPNKMQHWGYIDTTGKLAISDRFQFAADFCEGLAAVNEGGLPFLAVDFAWGCPMVDRTGRRPCYPMMGGKWGYINRSGELVIPLQFDEAQSFADGLARVKTDDRYRFIKPNGEVAFACPAEMLPHDFSEGLAAVIVGEWPDWKYGYLDREGNLAIPSRFRAGGDFSEGLAFVRLSDDGKWGFIDKTGKMVIEPRFDRPFSFHEGRGVVQTNGRFGFVDTRGRWIIPAQFEAAHDFCEGLAPAKLDGKWGYIDIEGKFVIAPQFVGAGCFRGGVARVAVAGIEVGGSLIQYGTWGFIDKSGKLIVPAVYDWATDFWEGRALVYRNSKSGFKDHRGQVVLEPEYCLSAGRDGLLSIEKNGKYGLVEESTGKIIVPLKFDRAECISEGRAVVRQGELWGLLDLEGRFIVEPKFYGIDWFHEGLAAVNVDPERSGNFSDGKYGYIDRSGRMVIEPQFLHASSFSEGRAAVWIRQPAPASSQDSSADSEEEALSGYIDITGKLVIQPRYAYGDTFHEGLAAVRMPPVGDAYQGKWGYIDREGKWVIEPKFDDAGWFQDGRARVSIGVKKYHVDRQGNLQAIP
jgi:hypothetical protein